MMEAFQNRTAGIYAQSIIFQKLFDIFNNLDKSFCLHQIHLISFGEWSCTESLKSNSQVYAFLHQLAKLIL